MNLYERELRGRVRVSQIHKVEQAQVKYDAGIGKSCYYIASALMRSSFEQAQMHGVAWAGHGVAWAKIHGVA